MKGSSDYPDAVRTIRDFVQKDKQGTKHPILSGIKLVNDQYGKVNGDGMHGPHQLRPRQNGNGRTLGGPLKITRT